MKESPREKEEEWSSASGLEHEQAGTSGKNGVTWVFIDFTSQVIFQ